MGNRQLAKLDETALASVRNKQLGFVFQDFLLLDGLTVQQNILLPCHHWRNRWSRHGAAR